MTFFRDELSEDTLTEIQTDASGLLNQTGNIAFGQSSNGKILTHALCKIQTDSATTGAFGYGAIYGTQGEVVMPLQGGGSRVTGLPALPSPVRVRTGMLLKVYWQSVADAVQQATICVLCKSGKADIFSGTAVDDTDVSLLNASGNTWGQSLSNERVVLWMATYSATNGLADTGIADGVDGFFLQSATGETKGMIYPSSGNDNQAPVPWIRCNIPVNQNDTATVRANV